MAEERKAPDTPSGAYAAMMENSVTFNGDITGGVGASGKFRSNLSKALHDAMVSGLKHKFGKPNKRELNHVLMDLEMDTCDIKMSSTVLPHGSITSAVVVDPAAGDVCQYAIDLLASDASGSGFHAFPGGEVDVTTGRRHTLLLTGTGERATKLDHPVDLLPDSGFLHTADYHKVMMDTAARCLLPTNHTAAMRLFDCEHETTIAAVHQWRFVRPDNPDDAAADPAATWRQLQMMVAHLIRDKMLGRADGQEILQSFMPSGEPAPVEGTVLLGPDGMEFQVANTGRSADDVVLSYQGEVDYGDRIIIPVPLYKRLREAVDKYDRLNRPYHIDGHVDVAVLKRPIGGEFVPAEGCTVTLKLNLVAMPQDTVLL